jgi:hypothetical protein
MRHGGTITAGGTAQTAIPANQGRKGALIQNPVAASETLFVAIYGAAAVGGAGNLIELAAGQSIQIPAPITGDISVNATTTGHTFLATEW